MTVYSSQYLVFLVILNVAEHNLLEVYSNCKYFAESILKNMESHELNTGMACALKFLIEDKDNTTKHPFPQFCVLTEFSNYQEPYQIFNLIHALPTKYSLSKFKSDCWDIVISLSTSQLQVPVLEFGDPLYDIFIFVSNSENLIKNIMTDKSVLNGVVRKYGIIIAGPVQNAKRLTYLVEPAIHTGSIIASLKPPVFSKINNLRGRTLNVVLVNIPPHSVRLKNSGKFAGAQYELVTEIATRTNFTVNVYDNMTKPGFGTYINGSWTGIVGELISGRADLTPALGPTLQRFPFISLSTIAYVMPLTLSLKTPNRSRHWNALIKPLTPIVWMLTLLSYLAITLFFLMNLETPLRNYHQTSRVFLLFYNLLLGQSGTIPNYIRSRGLLLTWIYFSYVIGTAYNSNLVSFLTFLEKEKVPTSFEELYKSPYYHVVAHDVRGMEHELLQNSTSPVIKGIVKRMAWTRDIKSCLNFAAQSKKVCVVWLFVFQTAIAKLSATNPDLNSLMTTKDSGGVVYGGVGFKKGSIYQETFNRFVGMAGNGHLVDLWRELYMIKVKQESARRAKAENIFVRHQADNDGSAKPLNVSSLLIVLFLIFAGLAGSLGVFLIEKFSNILGNRKNEAKRTSSSKQ